MATAQSLIQILESDNDPEMITELLKPAVSEAVNQGLIPKHVGLEDYVENWSAVKSILLAFLKNAEEQL